MTINLSNPESAVAAANASANTITTSISSANSTPVSSNQRIITMSEVAGLVRPQSLSSEPSSTGPTKHIKVANAGATFQKINISQQKLALAQKLCELTQGKDSGMGARQGFGGGVTTMKENSSITSPVYLTSLFASEFSKNSQIYQLVCYMHEKYVVVTNNFNL